LNPLDEHPIERAQQILERSGFRVRQLQPAGAGSLHVLFVAEVESGAMQLLRLARSRDLPTVMVSLRAEAEAVRRAYGIVPVAHPMILVPDEDFPEASLSPIVDGTRATDVRAHAPHDPGIARLCEELGRTLATLHTIRRPEGEPTHIASHTASVGVESEVLLHGDAHLGNLMVRLEKKAGYVVTALIDWSFCRWGPPEADLVEMAICEAEPRPQLGYRFLRAYEDAGGPKPRKEVFHLALTRELERRLRAHRQAYDPQARDCWTRWLGVLQRPGVDALRVFSPTRAPGRDLG
jgi:aminoglycoside phosphotransferase (APT) family kinase protein